MSRAARRRATVRPRRSVLYMPGSNQRALEKSRGLAADGLILDLEDAVAPEAKLQGRDCISRAVSRGGYARRELVVRVNGLETEWGMTDVAAVARLPIDAVLFPKVESPADVEAAVRALEDAGAPGSLAIWVMAETPRGILGLEAIAGSSERIECIVAGTSDLSKDLRIAHTPARLGFITALSLCVLAARTHGLDVLDGVHLDLSDDAGLEAVCRQGRELGFDGKTIIHPRQIETANRCFSPAPGEVEDARRTLGAWKRARAQGKGVATLDGRLIENLHVEQAERVLALDRAIAERG